MVGHLSFIGKPCLLMLINRKRGKNMDEITNELENELTFEDLDVLNKLLFWFMEEQGFTQDDFYEFMGRSDIQNLIENYINTQYN